MLYTQWYSIWTRARRSRVFAIGGQIRLTRVSRVTHRAHVLKAWPRLGGRRMCCIRSTILSSYLPLPSSSFPSSSHRSFVARPLPPFSTAAPNNSKRYRTKIGVQNYATRGSGISSSADLAPAVSLVLMTRHPSRPSNFAYQSSFYPLLYK